MRVTNHRAQQLKGIARDLVGTVNKNNPEKSLAAVKFYPLGPNCYDVFFEWSPMSAFIDYFDQTIGMFRKQQIYEIKDYSELFELAPELNDAAST